MKKKIFLMSAAGVLVAAAVIGGSLAAFNTTSEQGIAEVKTQDFGVSLIGTEAEGEDATTLTFNGMPGADHRLSSGIAVQNDANYTFYARVIIDKSWNSEDDLDASNVTLYRLDKDGKEVDVEASTGDWIVQSTDGNGEQVILYYTQPILAGENNTTTTIIDGVKIAETLDNSYTGKQVNIEIQVDAVQEIAAEDAMMSEWGVKPTINDAGVITAITE